MTPAEAREYQLSVIASEVRQWIKENPDSPHITVFGRSKQMFEAWLDCLDNAAADLLSAARAEGMEEANHIAWDTAGTTMAEYTATQSISNAIRSRISSLKPKTTDEAKP